jgi:hypothetical protein
MLGIIAAEHGLFITVLGGTNGSVGRLYFSLPLVGGTIFRRGGKKGNVA